MVHGNQARKNNNRPRRPGWAALYLLLALFLAACAAESPSRPHPFADAARTLFVTSNGWHSSIVIYRADLPIGRVPETADFPGARFLEFGWGDAEYYPAKETTLGMTLSAALAPTPAVVHLAGYGRSPALRYPKDEVVALPIDETGLARLGKFVHGAFDRAGRSRVRASGPGLYPSSRFYPATGRFHLFNTCNTWTARALAAAGFPVDGAGTTTAGELMDQVRGLAKAR